ncbi:helix-turn-helix domain-containing protein [Flammeovirga sp. OC4]|uniref:helix-turn-helix domain-containing protein n=1 Tax=Flammeovirga sp. OC4 TaxID=1382345 RepID=UPI0005C51F5C|nr:helix-turn-helix domain-containing protein [Flammeovirga sp. OC4]
MKRTDHTILTVNGDETNLHDYYTKLKKNFGGEVSQNEYHNDNDEYGKMSTYFYSFLPGLVCGFTSLKLKVPIKIINQSNREKKYISIRIGRPGDFTSESAQKSNLKSSIYLYNSNQQFSIDYPINQEMRWYFARVPEDIFYLLSDDSENRLKELIRQEDAWFYYLPLTPRLDKIVTELDEYIQDERSRRGMLFSKMIEIITIVKNKSEDEGFENVIFGVHHDDINLMIRIKDEILSDLKQVPNLKALTLKHGISESKLQRVFKKVYKKPVFQFYNHMRLEEAKQQVIGTKKELGAISFDLGFTDLTHFSKSYYQYFGERPSVTRKSQQEAR